MPLALLLFHEAHVYENYFDITYDPAKLAQADLVVFPGGGDWSPHYYGKVPHKYTSFSPQTDSFQMAIAREAIARKKKLAGHCRGAQLLCILNGDKLVQHVDRHHGSHPIMTKDGSEYLVNSIHHQMMIPTKNHELIAWSKENRSTKYETTNMFGEIENVAMDKEPEVVYFNDINGLAVQWHPEWMDPRTDGYGYYQRLIEEYLV